jgi:hypothetical protein
MRAIGVLVALLALPLSSLYGFGTRLERAADADRKRIIALEKAWAAAGPARDVAAYERSLADDFIGQWADGSSSTKAETIASLRSTDAYAAVAPGRAERSVLQRDCSRERTFLGARDQRR